MKNTLCLLLLVTISQTVSAAKPNFVVIFTDDQGYGDLSCFGGIERNKDEPFFLYIPHPIPHAPLHVSPPFMESVSNDIVAALKAEDGNIDYRTRDKLFHQAIAEIDWSVGQILDTLKANSLEENTLVLFTSDNGPPKNTIFASPGPLRGNKGTTFEGGMREPTVVRWPGKIPAGKPNDELMTAMDLLPTFAKLAGAETPKDRVIDGKDIWPVLTGDAKTPHEAFFYHRGNTLSAVRSGKWMLHTNKGKPTQLYDLESDIGEKNNVITSNPEVVERLGRHLKAVAKEIAENNRPAAFVENPQPLSMKSTEPSTAPAAAPSEDKASRANATKPNFVVIFADDLGYGDISCYGSTGVETPHLDALAEEGFRSMDFFVPANVCSPSRAALLTGRYPMRCGIPVARNHAIAKYKNYRFASDEITIPELLKPAGYRSLMVGKWHLGMEVEGSHPVDAGFDEHLGIPSNYAKNRGPNYNTLYRGKQVEQKNVPCEELIYLFDEILQGTNSAERHIAVSHVISHLVKHGSIGVVSTHDLELANSPNLATACQVVHFRETIVGEGAGQEMTFDYKMRPGLAPTTNALKLLEIVGLIGQANDSQG